MAARWQEVADGRRVGGGRWRRDGGRWGRWGRDGRRWQMGGALAGGGRWWRDGGREWGRGGGLGADEFFEGFFIGEEEGGAVEFDEVLAFEAGDQA